MGTIAGKKGSTTYTKKHTTVVSGAKELLRILRIISIPNKVTLSRISPDGSRKFRISTTLYRSSISFKVRHPDGDQEIIATFEGCSQEFFEELELRSKGRLNLVKSIYQKI
jgi:hypothetical protein